MQTTHVDALDRTVHKTNEWLKALQHELGAHERRDAYVALRATLHALRDRLPPNEALDLASQFPTLVRGIFFEGWKLPERPQHLRTRDEFLAAIRIDAGDPQYDADRAARAVFAILARKVSEGELDDVVHALPEPIRCLWPTRLAGRF